MHREDFKIFENYKNNLENKSGSDLVYFDNTSSSQTPSIVIESIGDYYTKHKSNIDRGVYKIEEVSTLKYEEARKVVANFIKVNDDEVIFTSSSTDSSNKLILSLEKYFVKSKAKNNNLKNIYENKNEIFLIKETHNTEYLPLYEYAKRNNLKIKIFENINELEKELSEKMLIVSLPLVSNVTGEIFELSNIFKKCNELNIFSICDLSAAAGHIDINIKDIGCNAAYFSSHKMCGPSGVGVLFVKREISRNMEPLFVGGGVASDINKYENNYEVNYRSDIKLFESGTQNISGVIGLATAIKYLENIGLENMFDHNQKLLDYFYQKLDEEIIVTNGGSEASAKETRNKIKHFIKIHSEQNTQKNIGIISFELLNKKSEIIHSHDVAQVLADNHICVRSGHHCADILLDILKVNSLTRISFYFYNNEDEINKFFEVLKIIINKF